MKILSAFIAAMLASCATQLQPEHGREKISIIGIGFVDRITTTRQYQVPVVQVQSFDPRGQVQSLDVPKGVTYNK